MVGPTWPRKRYELMVKKGTTPLGIKLHQTKTRRGVYTNGFTDGPYPAPGPMACMRVGDFLISVDGNNVTNATLSTALSTIEAARRRDRLRDFIGSKQDDHKRGSVSFVFERILPRLTFRDVALDPRKVVYLLNYMLEVRKTADAGEKDEVSVDEAKLMFWLEVHVLFEMSAIMTPSRNDVRKIYDKFFRTDSGFDLTDVVDPSKPKMVSRKTWDVTAPSPSLGTSSEDIHASGSNGSLDYSGQAVPAPAAADSNRGAGTVEVNSDSKTSAGAEDHRNAAESAADDRKSIHSSPPSSSSPGKSWEAAGTGAPREGFPPLSSEFQSLDLSRLFQISQGKVEEALSNGSFFRFKTSPWYGRMVAHLSNSPDYVHIPFQRVMAEPELRDIMMLHMIVTQSPGWLQVWREVELAVKPRLVVLQTRRSVRQKPSSSSNVHARAHSVGSYRASPSQSQKAASLGAGTNPGAGIGAVEAKTDAAMAILASAVYLWDFFLANNAHASLGLPRDSHAYTTLQELLGESNIGAGEVSASLASAIDGEIDGGGTRPRRGSARSPESVGGGDAGVDLAVAVGKALVEMQRLVLRMLCASVYPEFQASPTYEHLCDELVSGSRTPPRPPSCSATSRHSGNDGDSPVHSAACRNASHPHLPSAAASAIAPDVTGTERVAQPPPPPRDLSSNGTPRSPFAFLGGGSPGENRRRAQQQHLRRSSSPGMSSGAGGNSAGFGPPDYGGVSGGRDPWADALAFRSSGGRMREIDAPVGLSGPDFDSSWAASQGWVLEKVMRRIELPSHISRHRPPLSDIAGGSAASGEGVLGMGLGRRKFRSGGGTISITNTPELRRHLTLPYKNRRLGRRPRSLTIESDRGSRRTSPPSPPELEKHASSVESLGEIPGGWRISSPPGERSMRTLGVDGEADECGRDDLQNGVSKICAEWVLAFSASADQGVSTVQVEQSAHLRSSRAVCSSAPDGLESFLCPDLPPNGVGPCACSPCGGVTGSHRGMFGNEAMCQPCPQPRLFTFAAPGRSGTETFYGACLTVFRPVEQWTGEDVPAEPHTGEGQEQRASGDTSISESSVPDGSSIRDAAPNTDNDDALLMVAGVDEDEEVGPMVAVHIDGAQSTSPTASLTSLANAAAGVILRKEGGESSESLTSVATPGSSVIVETTQVLTAASPEGDMKQAEGGVAPPAVTDGEEQSAPTANATEELKSGKLGASSSSTTTEVSRFKMTIGRFGSGSKSGSSSTGKLSAYARRAGSFLSSTSSSHSKEVCRSPKPSPPLSPNTAAMGPPPPEPRAQVFLASPSASKDSVLLSDAEPSEHGRPDTAGTTSRFIPNLISPASGRGSFEGENPASENNGVASGGKDAAEHSKSGATTGARRSSLTEADDNTTTPPKGRTRHCFFVPSGICLLSTRPDIGSMRRSLAAYWRGHGDYNGVVGLGSDGSLASSGCIYRCQGQSADDEGQHDESDRDSSQSNRYDAAHKAEGTATSSSTHDGTWEGIGEEDLRDLISPFLKHRSDMTLSDDCRLQQRGCSPPGSLVAPEVLVDGMDYREERGRNLGSWDLDFDPSVVLRCLNPRHLCLVVLAMLCERKIVFVSKRLSLLTMAGEVFRALLRPLCWTHVYVPLLPRRMAADLLQCPTPFLLGVHAQTAREVELPKDVVQVHLDTDYLVTPDDFVGLAPMSSLCDRLCGIVNPGLTSVDDPRDTDMWATRAVWTATTADGVRAEFGEFVSELLQGAAECTFKVGQGSTLSVLLDERLYKLAKAAAAEAAALHPSQQALTRGYQLDINPGGDTATMGPLYNRYCAPLLDQFVKTQMLSQYLSDGAWE